MPPDILAKIFDPFFTTKGEGKVNGAGSLAGARFCPSVRRQRHHRWRTWAVKRKRSAMPRRPWRPSRLGNSTHVERYCHGRHDERTGPGPHCSQKASRLLIVLATGYSEAAGQAAAEFTVLRKPYNVTDLDQAIFDARRRQAARQRKVVDLQTTKRERAAKGK